MKQIFKTNRGRKITWSGEMSNGGKLMFCHTSNNSVVLIDPKTGKSVAGQNKKSPKRPQPATYVFANVSEYIDPSKISEFLACLQLEMEK